jgi:Integrase zinc binding domain
VIMHDNRPIAVAEQFYELLCHCHARVDHGGRDRTLAVIREYYSWVPKRITAMFVAACPTCNIKKNRGVRPAAFTVDTEHSQSPNSPLSPASSRSNSTMSLSDLIRDESHSDTSPVTSNSSGHNKVPNDKPISWSTTQDSSDISFVPSPQLDPFPFAISSIPPTRPSPTSLIPMFLQTFTESLPMSREVSLFDGLPNGMRYMSEEYAGKNLAAYEVHLNAVSARLPESKRPRIPSVIVPRHRGAGIVVSPPSDLKLDSIPTNVISQATLVRPTTLPPLIKSLSEGILGRDMDLLRNRLNYPASLPECLRALRVNEPQHSTPSNTVQRRCFSMGSLATDTSQGPWRRVEFPRPRSPQIDPVLLFQDGFQERDAMGRSSSTGLSRTVSLPHSTHGIPPTLSALIHRPVLPQLDLTSVPLSFPSTSSRDLADFVNHRRLSDGGDSSLSDNTSSSSCSSLSSVDSDATPFLMSARSSAATAPPPPP